MTGALSHIRVLDLSRVLAGPLCTQILGDLGADIIKVEKPGSGDDTRAWGPPFLKDRDGNDTGESAYYLSANRNKRSIAIDISTREGQEIIHKLLEKSDVMIENFKTGNLEKYGLDYKQIKERHPHIVYCAITGFGQTGPLAAEPGYDFLAQAMGGFMAFTGPKGPDGEPTKAGVAISDVMTGLYAAIGILAALEARRHTGRGQMVDVALTDCMLAGMVNIAQYYLTSGKVAPRPGNAHATIVPYRAFAAADGYVIITIGNDAQFRRFCAFIKKPEWANEFKTNRDRLLGRDRLEPMIAAVIATQSVDYWVSHLYEIDVPAGPVQDMAQAFEHPQAKARGMEIEMDHPAGKTKLVGSPLKMSDTPVTYRCAPPVCGQHTDDILKELLQGA